MLARGAPEAILPPIILGTAALLGAGFAHIAIGKVMSPAGADLLLFLIGTPGAMLLAVGIFLLWFYRDPPRTPGAGIVSAADGKVVLVETIDDPDVGPGQRIAVFMSPADVHVNRAPASAEMMSSVHHKGGYIPAFKKESERNERLVTMWRATGDDDAMGKDDALKVVQIAGAMAKRIDPWVEPGARLAKGARFGMIRLGSRVDVYLPAGYTPVVKVGDRVKAGSSPIARKDA